MSDNFSTHDRSASSGTSVSDTATAEFDLPAPRSLQPRTWLSLGMVVLVFLAGGLVGIAVARSTQTHKPIERLDDIPGRLADRMQRDLRLTQEQRDAIEQIGQAHQAKLLKIRAQIASEMREEISSIIQEVSAVLSPAQARRWREKAQRRLDALVPLEKSAPTPESDPANSISAGPLAPSQTPSP